MASRFSEGRYSSAAELYDANSFVDKPPFEAALLRARIHMRKPGEGHKAVSLLNRLKPSREGVESAYLHMLLGEAYAVVGDERSADSQLDAALGIAKATRNPEVIADVAYRLGRRYAVTGNQPDLAREYLQLVRKGRSDETRLNALHLESWILSREARARDQARVLMELLRSLDAHSTSHMEHRVRATQTLAALARELFVPEAVSIVERNLELVEWPSDFDIVRFQATKALGWAKALQGDYFNAFRFLKQSASVAPDAAWRTMAICDRAYLARVRDQDLWFRQELSDAEESAGIANWEEREDESVVALLLLAELFAPVNAAQASEYLARFHSIADIRDPRSLMRRDIRFEALVNYTSGVVDIELGNRKLGISRLRAAMKTYEQVGFEWRAARAAIHLYDATKKSAFLDLADKWLRNYGSSWLSEELRSKRQSVGQSSGLSPMRDRVFRLLCKGKSNLEIASLLGISVSTVANHAKAVLKAFSVSSRHALMAEAIRRGMLSR
jgi:DNA-binding CsgD family transcriptional regulator/tetratricopeptide (TPR) repeat protein